MPTTTKSVQEATPSTSTASKVSSSKPRPKTAAPSTSAPMTKASPSNPRPQTPVPSTYAMTAQKASSSNPRPKTAAPSTSAMAALKAKASPSNPRPKTAVPSTYAMTAQKAKAAAASAAPRPKSAAPYRPFRPAGSANILSTSSLPLPVPKTKPKAPAVSSSKSVAAVKKLKPMNVSKSVTLPKPVVVVRPPPGEIPYEALKLLTDPKNKLLSTEASLRLFTNKKDINAYVAENRELTTIEKFAKLRGFPKDDIPAFLQHIKQNGIETADKKKIFDLQQVVDECCYWPTSTPHFFRIPDFDGSLAVLTKHFQGNQALKRGDMLIDSDECGYRNSGKYLWDGNKAINLFYGWDDYGSLPKVFKGIQEFPVHFWNADWSNGENSGELIDHNSRMWVGLGKASADIVRKFLQKHAEEEDISESAGDNYCIVNEGGRKYAIEMSFEDYDDGENTNDPYEVMESSGPANFKACLSGGFNPYPNKKMPFDIVHKTFFKKTPNAMERDFEVRSRISYNKAFEQTWDLAKSMDVPFENMTMLNFEGF